jgi:hypothetical protein
MGQRFPLVHELTASEVPEKVEGAVEAVSGSLFPSMAHAMFQVESPGGESAEEVLRLNSQLFRFVQAIVEKGERLARLVKESIPSLRGEPLMFGGCYFAGTGRDSATDQAFASGVLMRLIREDQDNVTWTAEALNEDAAAHRLARILRVVFSLIIALGVLAGSGLIARKTLSGAGSRGTAATQER